MTPDTAEPYIPMLSEIEANATIAFVAYNHMQAQITAGRLNNLAHRNAEAAAQATKAADSLAKQLEAALAKVDELTPKDVPAAPVPKPTSDADAKTQGGVPLPVPKVAQREVAQAAAQAVAG